MKVLLYADFRSPHAKGWKRGLEEAGIDVVAVSSERDYGEAGTSVPVGSRPDDSVSKLRGRIATYLQRSDSKLASLLRRLSGSQPIHSLVYMIRRRGLVRRLQAVVRDEQPDLIHSLRIPYESVTVLHAKLDIPWVVSTWGQDFVPQAASDRMLRRWTRSVVRSVDGIHYDSATDFDRAIELGLRETIPHLFAAGNFGVDERLFFDDGGEKSYVVYPRKIAATVNYWGFIHAVAGLLRELPEQVFVGVGLKPLEHQILDIYPDIDMKRFQLTGALSQSEYAEYVRRATVVVSPSYTDGTPNSVLEAISSGAWVVAGDLPQYRTLNETLSSKIILVNASEDRSLSEGIRQALSLGGRTDRKLPKELTRPRNAVAVPEFYRDVLSARSQGV